MLTLETIQAIHAEARSSFSPRDAQHQYIQFLSVILQYRAGYQPRKGSVGRDVCRRAIRKARELKARSAKGFTGVQSYMDLGQ